MLPRRFQIVPTYLHRGITVPNRNEHLFCCYCLVYPNICIDFHQDASSLLLKAFRPLCLSVVYRYKVYHYLYNYPLEIKRSSVARCKCSFSSLSVPPPPPSSSYELVESVQMQILINYESSFECKKIINCVQMK